MAEETILEFADRDAWRAWLEEHHAHETEVWVIQHKKASRRGGLRYPEAVEEALAFGWIDSRMHPIDAETFAQRFSPRRPDSIWAPSNIARVEKLIAEGRMAPAGLAIVEEAKRRGTWGAYPNRRPTATSSERGED